MDHVYSAIMVDRPFTKISLRLYEADQDLHLAIRKALSGPHLEASDTDAARFIYERGLASASRELGIKCPTVAPKKVVK
jgi:hypothetical protein